MEMCSRRVCHLSWFHRNVRFHRHVSFFSDYNSSCILHEWQRQTKKCFESLKIIFNKRKKNAHRSLVDDRRKLFAVRYEFPIQWDEVNAYIAALYSDVIEVCSFVVFAMPVIDVNKNWNGVLDAMQDIYVFSCDIAPFFTASRIAESKRSLLFLRTVHLWWCHMSRHRQHQLLTLNGELRRTLRRSNSDYNGRVHLISKTRLLQMVW